ncbi:uncharacterized protein LOC110919457 [Helianthus annuus]|uniref:uncharacterized protein LOC110919457 n=1 Tax=Helianthus annuus TaxID=4232 RepID=UPI000B902A26|nr:uncharacterized protein LOC110919457 [Helianthus annuus]
MVTVVSLDMYRMTIPTTVTVESLAMYKKTIPNRERVKTGKDNGYVIVIKRSNKKGSNFKIWFQCSLGGEYKSVSSKKTGCPFELIGFAETKGTVWKIEVKDARHNHTPIEKMEGHTYARRLSSEDKRLIEQLAEQDMPNRSIWCTLMKKNLYKKIIPKDVHNAVQKINAGKRVGEYPMQQLENLLVEKDFTYYMCVDEMTNAVEDIFFVHPLSFTMWS